MSCSPLSGPPETRFAVCTATLPELTPEEAVEAIHAAGYHGVEWRVTETSPAVRDERPSFWRNNRCTLAPTESEGRRARLLAQRMGLQIPCVSGYSTVSNLTGVEQDLRFTLAAEARSLRVRLDRRQPIPFQQQFDTAVRQLVAVVTRARVHGVRVLIEMHQGTICPSASLAHRLVSRFDPAAVGVIYDVGNMVVEGFEPYPLGVDLLGPYLAHVHLKDGRVPTGGEPRAAGHEWVPMGDGMVDFGAAFAALASAGYDGWFSNEDFSGSNSDTRTLRDTLQFFHELQAENQPTNGGRHGA